MKLWKVVLLLTLTLYSTALAGPVLVYRGMGRQVGKNDAIVSGAVNLFVLVDAGTRQVASLTFYTRNSQKLMFKLNPALYRRVAVPLDTGKTSTFYNLTTVLMPPNEYLLATRTLRGTNSGLKVSSQSVIPLLHPTTLSGVEVVFAENEEPKASELRYTVTFQRGRTIAANDANKTLQQVFDDLISELEAKGY